MKEQLENIINRFQNSSTSTEAYQAISDFTEIILKITKLIEIMEKEGLAIETQQRELIINKADYTNEYRNRQNMVLHQMNTLFFFKDLYYVYEAIKSNNLLKHSFILFHDYNPDDPMPEYDKKDYQKSMDKVYKKALPFLLIENNKQQPEDLKVKSYNEASKTLFIGNYEIPIAKNDGNNNAHEIMAYIFLDNKDKLKDKFYYADIAGKRFEAEYNSKDKYSHQPYSGACKRINERIAIATNGQIKNFLNFDYSTLGNIQINPEYL